MRYAWFGLFAMACVGGGDRPEGENAVAEVVSASTRTPHRLRAPRSELPPPGSEGEALYRQYCLPCHGVDGRGNQGLAASYVDDQRILSQSDDELLQVLREGKRGDIGLMPPWEGTLTEAEMRSVVAYLRSRWGS